jgi:PBP1b-binding outer membrane lipoprotein LpoB
MTFGAHPHASVFDLPMKNLTRYLTSLVFMIALSGCSKKGDSTADAPSPTVTDTAAKTPTATPTTSPASQGVPSQQVIQDIKAKQYDRAVDTLVQIKPQVAQMTDSQRLQYQQAVRDAMNALAAAQNTDPAAKAAYNKMSRAITGR